MHGIILCGIGFGDEGKGATVDYYCRTQNVSCVVRYNGGSQAAHNVTLPNGDVHTFAQWGSGTLAGVPTFLSKSMIINLPAMWAESEHLKKLQVNKPFDLLTIHPECLISTWWHRYFNQWIETQRGEFRHGTCGHGIGQTIEVAETCPEIVIRAKDLNDLELLTAKCSKIQDYYNKKNPSWTGSWHMVDTVANKLYQMGARLQIAAEPVHMTDMVVFEGAQGLLLDERYGWFPHVTRGDTSPAYAQQLCELWGISDVLTLGVCRTYATRHGAGPFPCGRVIEHLTDQNNPTNEGQGSMRMGTWNQELIDRIPPLFDGLIVNHYDEHTDQKLEPLLQKKFGGICLRSFGPTWENRI